MSIIVRQDTNGVKPLLQVGELGYDNFPAGGDKGRVYVGTGTENISMAKKIEVTAVDAKVNTHTAKIDNPHSVTKAQVGLGNADNTADINKNVLSATKLTTARTINGVSFDGTANIVAPTNLGITAGTTAGPIVTSSTGTNATLPTATASASGVVTTGDQNWAGVKTFSSSPIVPTASTATQAVNKGQLDLKAPLESPTFTGTPKIGTDNITSISTSVTDNTIARFDGTTGKLQNSGVIIDDNGNVGIGATPSAWFGGYTKAIEIGTLLDNGTIWSSLNQNHSHIGIGANFYMDNSFTPKYKANYPASRYEQSIGDHYWQTAPSGTAGSPIPWTNTMVLDANGNLLLTSGTGALGYGAGAGGVVTQLTSKSESVTLNKPSGIIMINNEALAGGATVEFILNNSLISSNDSVIVNINNLNAAGYNVWATSGNNGMSVIRVKNVIGSSLSDALPIQFSILKGAAA